MEATRAKSGAGFTQSWRELSHTPSKQNVQNGSIVAMIAGLAITVLVATQLGLFAGLLLLAGAIWSLASTR